MTQKQINKWLRHRFSIVGWVLAAYFAIMYTLAMAAMGADALGQAYRALVQRNFSVDMEAVASNAWGYILTIAVGLMILWAWKGRDYWKQEIGVRSAKMTPGVLFTLLSFCIGAQMVNSLWVGLLETMMNAFGKSLLPMLETVAGASESFSMFLYASLLAPIAEEILFRGYVLRTLRPYGKRFAILCSALLFGLFHGNLMQAPYAFLIGLVLGWVTVEYSIHWAILLHMFNNLVLADILSRLTASLPETALVLMDLILFGGFALVSAIMLICKRREIRAYRDSDWMDRRCLKCFFTNSGILVLTILMVLTMASMFFI